MKEKLSAHINCTVLIGHKGETGKYFCTMKAIDGLLEVLSAKPQFHITETTCSKLCPDTISEILLGLSKISFEVCMEEGIVHSLKLAKDSSEMNTVD